MTIALKDYDADRDGDEADVELFEWTVTISVHPVWVADGFDLEEHLGNGVSEGWDLSSALDSVGGAARAGEVQVAIQSSPDSKLIRKVQGYSE